MGYYPKSSFGLIDIFELFVTEESHFLNILIYLSKICILLKHASWYNKIKIYFQVGGNSCFSGTAAWSLILSDNRAAVFY